MSEFNILLGKMQERIKKEFPKEKILCSILTERVRIRGKKMILEEWENDNTFYNTWYVLTPNCILLLTNTIIPKKQIFIIPLMDIIEFQGYTDTANLPLVANGVTLATTPTITMRTNDRTYTAYIIPVLKALGREAASKTKEAFMKTQRSKKTVCIRCKNLITKTDKFCAQCGEELN